MKFQQEMEQLRQQIEARLGEAFPDQGLGQVMAYSLMAGGKRIRPLLVLEFCKAAGGDTQQALDAACGVEMLHTYSLIHDDLPCMDNDDLRRGKPTCHKVYGECEATLAGDALQAAAFEWVLTCPTLEDSVRARMGLILARAAGLEGMCGGQYLDMKAEGRKPSLEELTLIHGQKTAALLRASCQIGVLCAGLQSDTDANLSAAGDYAEHLGMAFQIKDDLLDATSTTEILGKPVGSDQTNGKHTFVSILGREDCTALVMEHTRMAQEALEQFQGDTAFLKWLAGKLAGREH